MTQNNAKGQQQPTGVASGDLAGTYPSPIVAAISSATTSVNVNAATAPTVGQVLTATDGTHATWQAPASVAPNGSAGGDLGGTYPNPTVVALHSATTSININAATAPSTGQVLTATDSTHATWQAPAGGAPTGSAGGDLTGTYPNPTLAQLQGKTLSTTLATVGATQDGYALTWVNASTEWQAKPAPSGSFSASGDLSGSSSSQNVIALHSATTSVNVGSATAPTSGQILTATSSTAATWQTPAASGIGTGGTATLVTKTASYSITTTDYIILCNHSGAINLTLPAPAAGRIFVIKDRSGAAETNNVTLVRNAAEKIEGVAASRTLATNWGKWTVVSDGTDWYLV